MRKKCIFSSFFKLVKLSFKKKIYLGIRTSDWEKNYCSLQSKSYANNRRSSEKCVERTRYQVGSAPSKLLVRRINRLFSATTTPKSPPTLQRSNTSAGAAIWFDPWHWIYFCILISNIVKHVCTFLLHLKSKIPDMGFSVWWHRDG